MSFDSSSRPRAVVTGFTTAHARLDSAHVTWAEYSSHASPHLRELFHLEAEISGSHDDAWWERFFSCGIIGALESSGLWLKNQLTIDPARVGVCFGSSKGRPARWETSDSFLENSVFAASILNSGCDWALREALRVTRATGKRLCPVAACAGGAHAIAIGAQWIEDDLCDVVICGAIEAELAQLVLAGYRSLGALSAEKIMRPFDEKRDGFVPAPGAACLILESAESAARRGAETFGAVGGWSFLADASSLTGLESSGQTIARAIEDALQRAAKRSGGAPVVDYVNAHGTATRMNDEIEARAIKRVLGSQVPVSSTKPLTGHTLGAAGAVEAVFCLLAMQQNFAPPNLNLENKDSRCEIEVSKTGRELKIETALSLSYGFGGHIGVLLLEKN